MTEVLTLTSAWTLAGIFLYAAAHKLRNHLAFRGILIQYRLLPEPLLAAATSAIITLEIIAGVALLAPASLVSKLAASALAALLLCLYTVAITVNLIRGRTAIDCGCGGQPTPLSGWLVARNGFLLALAWAAGTVSTVNATLGLYLLAAAPTVFLWCAYAIANQLLANRPKAWPESANAALVPRADG